MARHGIFVAPFDELYDPRRLADLAARAEDRGWEGFFVWDHIRYRAPVRDVADPWIALAAIATRTTTIRLGPMITPPARRRSFKLARETVTLDHLSGGRLVFGAGLGSDSSAEFLDFEPSAQDPKERARRLDEGLADLARYWAGDLTPPPVQQPRIPVWLAGRYPARKPLERAACWDGYFPIDLPGPDALAEIAAQLATHRTATTAAATATATTTTTTKPFDLVVTDPPGTDWQAWVDAGATWCLTGWDEQPRLDAVIAAIDDGPPATT